MSGQYAHLSPAVLTDLELLRRKESFERAHPGTRIFPDPGFWQAVVPLSDGMIGVLSRGTLGELLDALYEHQRAGALAECAVCARPSHPDASAPVS